MLISKIDEYGKMGWIALTLAAFWLAWPVGFAVLAYLYGSGRMQAWRSEVRAPGTWFNLGSGGLAGFKWPGARSATSGNQAFDDYRDATLRRLEEEQQEFQTFLERLRKARDKAEFDAFMAERRQRAGNSDPVDVSTAA